MLRVSFLLQKLRESFGTGKRTYLLLPVWVAAFVFSFAAFALSSKPVVLEPNASKVAVSESSTVESTLVDRVSGLIFEGNFDSAGEVIEQADPKVLSQCRFLSGLAEIVREYEDIGKRRQLAQQAAYEEQLAELEKFKTGKEPGDVNGVSDVNDASDVSDANDVRDANDANDISAILSVITKANEFADPAQRERFLSDAFVKEIIQKAVDQAEVFELENKWLEAYINCYYWLQIIEPNNEGYSEYTEQLLDKAAIDASFQDSPCETSEERYKGVRKEMFIRAIDYLGQAYVSVIDFGKMATKAVNRCKLLAEVMDVSNSEDSRDEDAVSRENEDDEDKQKPPDSAGVAEMGFFVPPEHKKLAAWSVTLGGVLDEIDQGRIGFGKDEFIDVFRKVLSLNLTTANLPDTVLISQFSEAALATLDPYTVMVWPRQVQDFEKMMTNEFTGIGIEISKNKGELTVASLLPDTPAYKSGLDVGDVIKFVDGVETKDMTLMCAVHKITGPKGTEVTLTIKPAGKEDMKDIIITRAKITVQTIRGWQRTETGKWLYMLDDENKIGYVRITSFSSDTSGDLEGVLDELEANGLKGLILDLRFNSGGLLDSAIAIADKFVEEGPIVMTRPPRIEAWTTASAHRTRTHPRYPLVILINSSSASASEIVAGALADEVHERAILAGTRTHGKGSVQGITKYPGGGAQLKYTMAYYHLPSGQRVESRDAMKKRGRKDWGVGPNVEIELTSNELKEMIDVQRDNDVLVQANHDNTNGEHTVEETLLSDAQLAVGTLVLRSKLIQAEAAALASVD